MANNEHINKVVKSTGETLIDLTGDTVTPSTLLQDVTAHDKSGAQITGTLVPVTGVKGNDEDSYRTGNVNLTPADIGAAPLTSSSTIDFVGEGLSLTKPGETNHIFDIVPYTMLSTGDRRNDFYFRSPGGNNNTCFLIQDYASHIYFGWTPVNAQGKRLLEFSCIQNNFSAKLTRTDSQQNHPDIFKFNWNGVGDFIGKRNDLGTAALSGSTLDLWYETIRFNGKVMDMFAHSGQSHNCIWRGKYLGDTFTAAQKAAIADGSFDDLFVGDYWTINGVDWVIADIDYYYGFGDTACWTHHLVIVPRRTLIYSKMNDTNTAEGAYVGSKMRTEVLLCDDTTKSDTNTIYGIVCAAFGESNILEHRVILSNGVTNNQASSWGWRYSKVDLLNQTQINGQTSWGSGYVVGTQNSQLAAFRLNHNFLIARDNTTRYWYWLSDVISNAGFGIIDSGGNASTGTASNSYGVRPHFCLCGGTS